MGNQSHYHRPMFSLARIFTLITLALGAIQIASAQTRIISLSGDLDFGRVPINSSSQRVLAISNLGDSVLTVSNLDFPLVPIWGQASFHGNWSGTILPNSTQFVNITFTPMGFGIPGDTNDLDLQGYLTVNSDATSGANYMFLSGVGTWPPANPSVHLDFGKVPLASTRQVSLLLTNIGALPVTISNLTVPYGFSSFFGPP
jgi:hypothetical protein